MKLIYFGQEAWEEQYIKDKLPGIEVAFRLGTIQEKAEGNMTTDAEAEAISIFLATKAFLTASKTTGSQNTSKVSSSVLISSAPASRAASITASSPVQISSIFLFVKAL